MNTRALFTMMLLGSLLLTGCAKNATMDQPPTAAASTEQTFAAGEAKSAPVAETVTGRENMQTVFFDFDSYLLTSLSKEMLQMNARVLQAQPEVRIIIEGHTDERGSSTYNLALGEKRAQAARAYLHNLGIAAERIKVVSYGQEKPALPGSDESAWAKNRRAEFVPVN